MVTEPALHQRETWHGWALVTSLTAHPAGYLAVSRDSLLSSTFTFRVFTLELIQQQPLLSNSILCCICILNASSFH